jgi:glycosyltransferase involved in cell wall biosynthesis
VNGVKPTDQGAGRPSGVNASGCHIYVDATGLLALGGSMLTGIPRVEHFFVTAALADTDRSVDLVLYDERLKSYRGVSAFELRVIESITAAEFAEPASGGGGTFGLLRHALRAIGRNPFAAREFDRQIAARVASHRRNGFLYTTVKHLIRVYRFLRHSRFHARRFFSLSRDAAKPENGIILMSNKVVLNVGARLDGATPCRKAFVCHDLIPVLYGHLATSERHAQRFARSIEALVRGGALALCTSDVSRGMLERYMASRAPDAAVRIGRFPMPSMLYEKAQAFGRVGRLEARQPFVIFCSTVEIRKNHAMMVRIWKQALAEGVALPKLICVGNWGWKNDALQAELGSGPDLRDHVTFIGSATDGELIDLYRSALFGLMPSFVEGWGLSASECLDFGTPVIISTAPALREATRGLMPAIAADDQAGWYKQIRLLAMNASEREALHGRITKHYRPVTTAESWQAIKAALHGHIERAPEPVAISEGASPLGQLGTPPC